MISVAYFIAGHEPIQLNKCLIQRSELIRTYFIFTITVVDCLVAAKKKSLLVLNYSADNIVSSFAITGAYHKSFC